MENNIKPIISTITPCFRMKPYLKKFLEELPKQTYFDKLEIVLDHNEPDEEELNWVNDFISRYPGKIKHIITNPVVPIGTSMNKCIKEASADLLTIWNVDDLRTPNSIELQVLAFENGADIVYGDFIITKKFGEENGKYISFAKFENKPEEFTRSMLLGPYMAFRKSLILKSGLFDEQLKSGADFDLAIRLAFIGKTLRANGLLGYYLNEGKGASTRPDSKQQIESTVIELRYGIYDKIDYDLIPETTKYSINNILINGENHNINEYLKNHSKIISDRYNQWHKIGINRYILSKLLNKKGLKRNIKKLFVLFKTKK